MIKLKIARDDTRMLQNNFFPFLTMMIDSRIKECGINHNENELMNWKIIRALFVDIKKVIARKLLTEQKNFSFAWTDAEAITLYRLLMAMPMSDTPHQIYMMHLRNSICQLLHQKMSEPC